MIYCTGYNGFLLSAYREFRKDLEFKNIINDKYTIQKFNLTKDDYIFDFGFPISDDYTVKMSIATKNTLHLIMKCCEAQSKYVYASTMGVLDRMNSYDRFKYNNETGIKILLDNYLIVRIPRVYDKTRKNGLMKSLREGLIPREDYHKIIDYSTLDNFLNEFNDAVFTKTGITYISENRAGTIATIANLYC